MSNSSTSLKQNSLSDELSQDLLAWLDPTREVAEEKYRQIRAMLSEIFESRGCEHVEALVCETIVRAFEDLPRTDAYPADYKVIFRRAAKRVLRDYFNVWASTPQAFQRLLRWLDTDEEQAGRKYAQIHATLCRIFITHGFTDAEGLADQAITRVIKKLPGIEKDYKGNPALYFSGVAKIICKEQSRLKEIARKLSTDYEKQKESSNPLPLYGEEEDEEAYRKCYKSCLSKLKADERDLLLKYYLEEKGEKVRTRKDLASKLGITPINLRVRRHRAQSKLEKCISECLNLPVSDLKSSRFFKRHNDSMR